MSRCPAHEQLEQFLGRCLAPADHLATIDHLRDCPGCRAACDRLAAVMESDTVTIGGPPPLPPGSPDEFTSRDAPADAPTVRLWRHQLGLRNGERPVKAGSAFNIAFATPSHPLTIPGYDILGELGRGGMGVVFKARQVKLNRFVALKMIHAEELTEPDTLARFRTEAEAVARLQHPNIVQIYEVGEADGRPFFSLEYVGGGNLAKQAAGKPQPAAAAASLVEVLARTVHYAHSQGVIHRDLKPGNVLLQIIDSKSGISNLQCAIPKVADFGLAKYTTAAPNRSDTPSRHGLIIGTPQYMAPEQAGSAPEAASPAIDIYALGAILYELLTGRPPFQGANAIDTLLQVRLMEPLPPRAWQPKTPRDLETISLKCLEKEPRLRYASARELADDLRRFQDGVPIRARPASLTERAWKLTRRHPALTLLGITAAITSWILFAGMAWRWRLAEDRRIAVERNLASSENRLADAERGIYCLRIVQAHEALLAGRFAQAAELLRQCQPTADRSDLRGWEWHYLQRFCTDRRDPVTLIPGEPEGTTVSGFRGIGTDAVSSDGRRSATISPDGAIVLRDTATRQEILTLRLPLALGDRTRLRVEFNEDGRRLTVTWPGGAAAWDAHSN